MISSWIVAASGAVGAAARHCWQWLIRVFWGPRFWKIASEFFLEAAVLIAVFPILDTWVTEHKVTVRWMVGSEVLAVLLLALASILASIEHGGE